MDKPTKTQFEIGFELEVDDRFGESIVYSNRFFVEKQDSVSVVYLGFESRIRFETSVHCFVIADHEIEQVRSTWEKYLEDCGTTPGEIIAWRPDVTVPPKLHSANILALSRTNDTAEIVVRAFLIQDIANLINESIKSKKSDVKSKYTDQKVKAKTLLTVRMPLDLQLQLIIWLLSAK